ncbi:MAG TPA: hypothetical protein VF570_03090 [Pyrinomonadaceae bacterium]
MRPGKSSATSRRFSRPTAKTISVSAFISSPASAMLRRMRYWSASSPG